MLLIWEDLLACLLTTISKLLLWPVAIGSLSSAVWPAGGTAGDPVGLSTRLTPPFAAMDPQWWLLLVMLANGYVARV